MSDDPYEPEELGDEFFENLLPEGGGSREEKKRKLRLNFDEARTQYANFCTLSARRGEVYLCFGQAFPPVKELKVGMRVVMSVKNAEQLQGALARLLDELRGGGRE